MSLRLGHMRGPDPTLFPVNHSGSRVQDLVWRDLVSSQSPLVLAGFASITKIIELVAALGHDPEPASVRILLGTEPFATERVSFGSSETAFTNDVRAYWMEQHGVSLLLFVWLVALRIRLGTASATVATITAAGIVAPLAPTLSTNHLALLVLAIGCGWLFFSHVNDAGFWLVKECFVLSVGETIKSWSVMETVISVFGFALVMVASFIVT